MPGKILGLDISQDSITAVQILSGLKGYQVTACAQVMIDEDGGLEGALKKLFEQTDLRSDTYLTSIPAEYVSYRNLQMPFREPKKIKQTLPFEIETVVPFPIEDLVVDFTVVDRSDKSEILGASVRKAYIAEYLALFQAYGIDPEVLDIRCVPTVSWLIRQEETPESGLLLEIGLERNMMILYLKRRIALIRTFALDDVAVARSISDVTNNETDHLASEQIEYCLKSFCTMIQNTIHSLGWQMKRDIPAEKVFLTGMGAQYPETEGLLSQFLDIPVEQIDLRRNKRVHMENSVARVWNPALMDNALALALRADRHGQGFNFRKDEFEVRKRYSGLKAQIRKFALFFIIILAFLVADLGLDYHLLKSRSERLDQNITEVFSKTFPGAKRIKGPVELTVHQMEEKIKEIKESTVLLPGVRGNQRVLDLLKDISQRISESMDMHVTRLVIDPETVRISGDTDTFNTVDSIKNSLEPSAYFGAVTISSANLDRTGKRVQFEIKLQRVE